MKVYYLVYKLTNLVNSKIYIGCHATQDVNDGYMGSGTRLGYAKKKYGVENFKKEILSTHESPEEMLAEEARLVNEEFLGRDDVYNLTCGGQGSWFHVNLPGNWKGKSNWDKANPNLAIRIKMKDPLFKAKVSAVRSLKAKKQFANGHNWSGKNHSEQSKKLMSEIMSIKQNGDKNSQFGTCWIMKDEICKKIKKEQLEIHLLDGWKRGRKINLTGLNTQVV